MAKTAVSIQTVLLNERLRISSILEAPEAVGREKLAAELALRSSMSSEAALSLLKSSPKASTTAAQSFLAALQGEAIGMAPVAAEVITDPKAKRLAEIKANTRRVPKAAQSAGA